MNIPYKSHILFYLLDNWEVVDCRSLHKNKVFFLRYILELKQLKQICGSGLFKYHIFSALSAFFAKE